MLVVTLFAPSAPQIEVSRATSLHIPVSVRMSHTNTRAIQMYLFLSACNMCDSICLTFKDLLSDLMEFSNSLKAPVKSHTYARNRIYFAFKAPLCNRSNESFSD